MSKGGTEDTVLVMDSALQDLKHYMQIRESCYKVLTSFVIALRWILYAMVVTLYFFVIN